MYPALALADRLKSQGHEVLFVGTPDTVQLTRNGYHRTGEASFERRLARKHGIDFEAIDVLPLDSDYTIWRGKDRAYYPSLYLAPRSWRKARKPARDIIKRFDPDVVVGFGGYVCAPIVSAAGQAEVPVILHEQNSIMGKANKRLSRHACALALTYEDTGNLAPLKTQQCSKVTGNPVRPSMHALSRGDARARLGIDDDEVFVLVFGGSKGARRLNDVVIEALPQVLENDQVHILHATGAVDFKRVCALREEHCKRPSRDITEDTRPDEHEKEKRYRLVPYIDDMDQVMPAADLVVARAGSTSIAEIIALGIPSILIPFPYAAADHQRTNAQPIADAGAAVVIPEKRGEPIDGKLFTDTLDSLIRDQTRRLQMREAAGIFGPPDALSALISLLEEKACRVR